MNTIPFMLGVFRKCLAFAKRSWMAILAGVLFLAAGQAGAYSLSVANGSGSGNYAGGAVVPIFANAYENPNATTIIPEQAGAPLRIFDRWTGDVASVADIYSPNTSLVMPKANASVTAQFKDAPNDSPPAVWSYFPANHRGVVFLFHGSAGSAANLLASGEVAAFVRDASARGLGVVAIDSYDRSRSSANWQTSPSAAGNADMQRVAAVRRNLIAAKILAATEKVYLWGFSAGGIFSSLFTQTVQNDLGFPVAANVLMASPGDAGAMAATSVPTIIITEANDNVVPYLAAAQSFNALISRGISSQLWTNGAMPVFDNRFWGIPGLSQMDSQTIYGALRSSGYLSADGYVLGDPEADAAWAAVIPEQFSKYVPDITDRLNASYAGHGPTANFNKKILDFYESPSTVIAQSAVISSISPSSGSAGTVVTISGNNFFGVSGVSFNGLKASFSYISSTTLVAVAPAKVTTGPVQVSSMAGVATGGTFTVSKTPVISGFSPAEAVPGAAVAILGGNFAGISSVTFNGVSAKVTSYGTSKINTVVPSGATTGFVKVVGSNGTAVSSIPFTVK
jgi:dienelactone hydrolase